MWDWTRNILKYSNSTRISLLLPQIVAVGQLQSTVLGKSGVMFAHSEYNHPVSYILIWPLLVNDLSNTRSPGSRRSLWSRLYQPGPSCPSPGPLRLCTAWWPELPPCQTTVSSQWVRWQYHHAIIRCASETSSPKQLLPKISSFTWPVIPSQVKLLLYWHCHDSHSSDLGRG